MIVVFDLDNTLADEYGQTLRPGIVEFLERLTREEHTLILWTQSQRSRAQGILKHHDLSRFFKQCLFREDYDPGNAYPPKDIRRVKGDVLIDDSPAHIAYIRSIGLKGVLVESYRGRPLNRADELDAIYREMQPKGWLKSLFGKGR